MGLDQLSTKHANADAGTQSHLGASGNIDIFHCCDEDWSNVVYVAHCFYVHVALIMFTIQ